ncbi:hypothetical protein H0H92_010363 [Tricholoma furcatifolium]|nr:hypothetical protein H0H92_010363 [Tricholoma furcatifolium]
MKKTLPLGALPHLAEKGATYVFPTFWVLDHMTSRLLQKPTPKIRKLTKSAKLRMKKRERAAKNSGEAGVGDDADPVLKSMME